MASRSNLRDLLELELKDTYSAETQLTKALPKMAKAATNPELRAGFEQHLNETQNHVRRLEQVAQEMNISLKGNTCEGMEGLIEEGEKVIALSAQENVKDAGLIAAAQKVEHYEISMYGTLCAWAKQLGLSSVATTLHQTLDEVKRTDEKLTQLAKQRVNAQAA
ncbi:MAG TPA: ferritin-like domain-containing protein [Gemmataceae bacterium]|nr:ferritin-like domain-containing protein [Gemmataceae bacterium]